jgi:pimeloyl-ACP methyl ester carboxylesterase
MRILPLAFATMPRPLLHFVHGNSYPAGAYRRLLGDLAQDYDVHVTDMLGHDPRFPVDDGWRGLTDELIADLARHGAPSILVGHSLGGAVSLRAALLRPDLVRCVVMLDSPIVAGWRAVVLRIVKLLGLGRRLSPGVVAERRRDTWPSRAAAREHFLAKPLFQAWAPGVLDDYLEHGLVADANGMRLRFDRETEARIYSTLPHDMGASLRALDGKPFPVPVGFIAGTESEELRQAGMGATRRLVGRHFVMIPGSHLYPMESPAMTAALVREMIARLVDPVRKQRQAIFA